MKVKNSGIASEEMHYKVYKHKPQVLNCLKHLKDLNYSRSNFNTIANRMENKNSPNICRGAFSTPKLDKHYRTVIKLEQCKNKN